MSKDYNAYMAKATELISDHIIKNNIDLSKKIGYELNLEYWNIIKQVSPRGLTFVSSNHKIYLQFKVVKRSKHPCNELITKQGCINALSKALCVLDKLKSSVSETDFFDWYNCHIKEISTIENDIITIGDAIALVTENYFQGDHNGISRSDPQYKTNFEASYESMYGRTYKHLESIKDQQLTAKILIEHLDSRYKILKEKKTKGFKSHVNNCQKLLIETKLTNELTKFKEYYGKIKVKPQQEMQEISLETFLQFRDMILGLNGYQLTKSEQNYLENRKSWFKALSINLLYGFRGSECLAITNLDQSITIGNRVFQALHDPTNKENILVLNDYYELTDDQGNIHKITIKTGKRFCIPMIHPKYPNLIDILEIKNPEVKLPVVVPTANSSPDSKKRIINKSMRSRLSIWCKKAKDIGFTQTHALRHLANHHGKLAGLTTEQRAKSLGHSTVMNDSVYNKHLDIDEQINFLTTNIENPQITISQLENENKQLREQIELYKKIVADLEIENANLKGHNITKLF